MKKATLFVLAALLILVVGYGYGIEVTVLGPKKYTRTEGQPNSYTDTFPGTPGKCKIVLQNGGVAGSDPVSSAIVRINGIEVFGTRDFSQNAGTLERNLSITTQNTIDVVLRSKPGAFLEVEIVQDIQASGAALVGVTGGICAVSNPADPLYGVELDIPNGAVQSPSLFAIKAQPNEPLAELPDNAVKDGPMIEFWSSSKFSIPIVAKIPFLGDRIEGELRLLYHFNDEVGQWGDVKPLPGEDRTRMRVLLESFSTYSKGRAYITTNNITTSFQMDRDVLRADNAVPYICQYDPAGPCVGFSLIAEQYFNERAEKNGVGLKCWWSPETSFHAACQAHGLYYGSPPGGGEWFLNKFGVLFTLNNDISFLVESWKAQLTKNRPVSLFMLPSITQLLTGHSVLIIGWVKTGPNSGRFIVYDNQNNSAPRSLDYTEDVIMTTGEYIDTANRSYTTFAFASTFYSDFPSILNVIDAYTRDYAGPCESTGNLIPNSSFEFGTGTIPEKWSFFWTSVDRPAPLGNYGLNWSSSVAHSGMHSIQCDFAAYVPFSAWVTDFISIDPSSQYEFSYWYKWGGFAREADGDILVNYYCYDSEGNRIGVGGYCLVGTRDNNFWKQSDKLTIPMAGHPFPSQASKIRISIGSSMLEPQTLYSAYWWIDDLLLIKK